MPCHINMARKGWCGVGDGSSTCSSTQMLGRDRCQVAGADLSGSPWLAGTFLRSRRKEREREREKKGRFIRCAETRQKILRPRNVDKGYVLIHLCRVSLLFSLLSLSLLLVAGLLEGLDRGNQVTPMLLEDTVNTLTLPRAVIRGATLSSRLPFLSTFPPGCDGRAEGRGRGERHPINKSTG